MSNFAFQVLYPIWIGIAFNLLVTLANFVMLWHGPIANWYFDNNGGIKIMVIGWAILITWSIVNGFGASV